MKRAMISIVLLGLAVSGCVLDTGRGYERHSDGDWGEHHDGAPHEEHQRTVYWPR